MRHLTFDNLFLFLLTVTLLFFTLYVPQTIYRQEDFRHIQLGLPLPFIVQDQVITPPLPWQTSLEGFYENPIKIIWPQFLIDISLVFGLLKFSKRFYYLNKIIKFMQYTLPPGVFLIFFIFFLLIICCASEGLVIHTGDPPIDVLQDQNFNYDLLPLKER